MASDELGKVIAVGEAKRIWRLYGLQTPQDLDLVTLALAMNVCVREGPLDSADARLVRLGAKGLIRLNDRIPQLGRKQFAIAHEIGHWRLHESTSQLLACTSEVMRVEYKGSAAEIEANYFASELLMPEFLFGPAIKGKVPEPDTINGLAAEFRTTRTATAVRFVELSREYCVMIVAENGCIKWWRASKEFDTSLWIKAGHPVSPRTLAGRFFGGRSLATEVSSIGMEDWADRYPDHASEAMEAIIPLGSTGAVLTMLWLE